MIGSLYFIQEGPGGAIKIGWTGADPATRLAQARLWNYREVRLLAALTDFEDSEKLWHSRFAKYRVAREWFQPHPELLEAIETAKSAPRPVRIIPEKPQTAADVRMWMASKRMTVRAFAEALGYNPSTVSAALSSNGWNSISLRMAGRIEALTGGEISAVGLMKSRRSLPTLTEKRLRLLQAVSAA